MRTKLDYVMCKRTAGMMASMHTEINLLESFEHIMFFMKVVLCVCVGLVCTL